MKLTAWKRAKRFGIDTSLIEANLAMSCTERVLALQSAVVFAEQLRLAGLKYYAKLRKNNKTAVG